MHRTFRSFAVALGILATFWIGLSSHAGASVFRCKSPDGRVSYQDSGCPAGTNGEPIDPTPNRGFRFADEQQIKKAMRPPPQERERPVKQARSKVRVAINAGERRFITAGVTGVEVRQRIGAPDRIVYPSPTNGRRPSRNAGQQWVYLPALDDPQTTTTLTVKGGMVTHVQRKVTR